MAGGKKGKIFINYRRGDEPGFVGRLYDKLATVYDSSQLFMDVDTLGATNDFSKELQNAIAASDVLLVMVGKGWTTAKNALGLPLGHRDDFVTLEIALALHLKKVVVPILVNGAPPLQEVDLPPILKPLAKCNALPLDHNRFRGDTDEILRVLLEKVKPRSYWVARWRGLANSSSREKLVEFIGFDPPQDLAQSAYEKLEELDWKTVLEAPTLKKLERFLAAYPSGKHLSEAQLWVKTRTRIERYEEKTRRQRPIIAAIGVVALLCLAVIIRSGINWRSPTAPTAPLESFAFTDIPNEDYRKGSFAFSTDGHYALNASTAFASNTPGFSLWDTGTGKHRRIWDSEGK